MVQTPSTCVCSGNWVKLNKPCQKLQRPLAEKFQRQPQFGGNYTIEYMEYYRSKLDCKGPFCFNNLEKQIFKKDKYQKIVLRWRIWRCGHEGPDHFMHKNDFCICVSSDLDLWLFDLKINSCKSIYFHENMCIKTIFYISVPSDQIFKKWNFCDSPFRGNRRHGTDSQTDRQPNWV